MTKTAATKTKLRNQKVAEPPIKTTTTNATDLLPESCPKCGSTGFSVADNSAQTRFCTFKGCSGVWMPMSQNDLMILKQKLRIDGHKILAVQILHSVDTLLRKAQILGPEEVMEHLREIRSKALGIS